MNIGGITWHEIKVRKEGSVLTIPAYNAKGKVIIETFVALASILIIYTEVQIVWSGYTIAFHTREPTAMLTEMSIYIHCWTSQ